MKFLACLRTAILCLSIFSLATAPVTVTAQSVPDLSGPQISDPAMVARMETAIERLEEARAKIDRRTFDIDARMDDLNFDPDEIIGFVTDDIAFEQYVGLLRGAEGTLMASAGNSLDQAVLLAGMLKDVGFDARIQRGTLETADAATLYNTLGAPRERPESSIKLSDLRDIAEVLLDIAPDVLTNRGEILDALSKQWDPETDKLYLAAMAEADALTEDLGDLLNQIRAEQTPEKFIEEITDYFWIEFRESAISEWTTVHPVMAGFAPEVVATETLLDEIPAELQHRIAFRVINERALGGKLEQTEIVPTWERPAANLHGIPISYMNLPANPEVIPEILEQRSIAPSQFFVPFFMGQMPPSGQIFDLIGNTATADVLSSPAAGFFQTASKKGSEAVGAVSGLGSAEKTAAAPTLVAQWIEIDQINPDGTTIKNRRTVVDVLQGKVRQVENMPPADDILAELNGLFSAHSFMINTGSISGEYIFDDIVERLVTLLQFYLSASVRENLELDTGSAQLPESDSPAILGILFSILDSFVKKGSLGSYRSESSIIALHLEHDLSTSNIRASVDIVANSRRSFSNANGLTILDAKTTFTTGVLESFAESRVFPDGRENRVQHSATWLRDYRESGGEFDVLLQDSNRSGRSGIATGPPAIEAISNSLSNNRTLLVPRSGDPNSEEYSWWSVDPSSGSSIAVARSGHGSITGEYRALFGISSALLAVVTGFCGAAAATNTMTFSHCFAVLGPPAVFLPGMMAAGGVLLSFSYLSALVYFAVNVADIAGN
jgi:hypothetical protein